MKHFLGRLALWFMMAALPLQNLHAVAMSSCDQDTLASAVHDHASHGEGMADHSHDDVQSSSSGSLPACDGCGLCNACSAPAVASHNIDALFEASEAPHPDLIARTSLFEPEQPRRPPRSS